MASSGQQSRLAKDGGEITGGSGESPDVGPDPPVIVIKIGNGERDKPRVGIPYI